MFTATDWIRDKNGLMVLTPFPIKWAGKAAKQVYHKLRQKDTGNEAASRTFLQRKGSVFVQPLSLTPFDSSPSRGASGETVHFAGTAKASPTRGGGSASALTERLYKDGPALGSSLVNLPPRLSPQNAKPPRSCDLPGGFFLRESPRNLREWQLHGGRGVV